MPALVLWSWYAFCIFWLLALLWSKPVAKRSPFGDRFRYFLPLAVGVVLAFRVDSIAAFYPLSIVVIAHSAAAWIIADILAILGVIIAIWARITLGANWSGSVQVKEGHELIESGPYRYMRHPIYTALLLLFLATAIALGTLGTFLGVLFVYWSFYIKYRQEEALMTAQFPGQYQRYRARVKALIPYIV